MKIGTDEVEPGNHDLLEMTADIVSSFVSNNPVSSTELPELIKSVHAAIAELSQSERLPAGRPEPAVPISKSVQPDFIVCLEDGRELTMLKRYLRSRYNLTPEEYRARWGLPPDYPMVAPNYSKHRSEFAKEIGLGRKKSGN